MQHVAARFAKNAKALYGKFAMTLARIALLFVLCLLGLILFDLTAAGPILHLLGQDHAIWSIQYIFLFVFFGLLVWTLGAVRDTRFGAGEILAWASAVIVVMSLPYIAMMIILIAGCYVNPRACL
jgi:hypothetical protein